MAGSRAAGGAEDRRIAPEPAITTQWGAYAAPALPTTVCATAVATSVQDYGSVDAFDGGPSELKPGVSFAGSDEADAA